MNETRRIKPAMTICADDALPDMPAFKTGIRRAPSRGFRLTPSQTCTALKNALRYIPPQHRITSYNVCYTKLLRGNTGW